MKINKHRVKPLKWYEKYDGNTCCWCGYFTTVQYAIAWRKHTVFLFREEPAQLHLSTQCQESIEMWIGFMYLYSRNVWLCAYWQWNTQEWCHLMHDRRMKHTGVVSSNAWQAKPVVHLVYTTRVFHCQSTHNQVFRFYHICFYKMEILYSFMWLNTYLFSIQSLYHVDWWILVNQSYCWCPIVMKWSLWLHHCVVTHWDEHICVTMAVDL